MLDIPIRPTEGNMEQRDIDVFIKAKQQARRERVIAPIAFLIFVALVIGYLTGSVPDSLSDPLIATLISISLMNFAWSGVVRSNDLLPVIERQLSRDPDALAYYLSKRNHK
jgi:hypothetical protein